MKIPNLSDTLYFQENKLNITTNYHVRLRLANPENLCDLRYYLWLPILFMVTDSIYGYRFMAFIVTDIIYGYR